MGLMNQIGVRLTGIASRHSCAAYARPCWSRRSSVEGGENSQTESEKSLEYADVPLPGLPPSLMMIIPFALGHSGVSKSALTCLAC